MNMNCDLKFNLSEKSSTLPADDFSNFLDDVSKFIKYTMRVELFSTILTDLRDQILVIKVFYYLFYVS